MARMLCTNYRAALGDPGGLLDFTRLEFLPAPERLDPPAGELHVWRLASFPSRLREVLAVYLGAEAGQIELEPGPHGKPQLAQPGRLRFNLSHSRELALIAVGGQLEVGVDVERMRAGRDVVALAERVLEPEDVAAVRGAPAARRDLVFHQLWTRHEARLKCLGVGLS